MTVFSDIVEEIKTAWQSDAEILAFCSEYYAARPALFFGMDDKNPPGQNYYPIISALEFRIRGAGSGGRTVFEVVVGCGVNDDAMSIDEENRTYIYQGVLRAEKLRSLAFAALVKNNFGKITVKGDTGQAASFPLFLSGMTVEIETINSRRRI